MKDNDPMATFPLNEAKSPTDSTDVCEEANIIFDRRSKFVESIHQYMRKYSSIPALFLLLLCCWTIGYSLFGDIFDIDSPIFALVVLFITAKITGCLVSIIGIPPMVGMLLMGVVLRNVGYLEIDGNYEKFISVLRQIALVNIMLPAGLALEASTLKRMMWMILNWSVIAVAVEIFTVAVAGYYLLDLPWLWGFLLGVLLAAVSPAVIIPHLFELQDLGYGVNKGIQTLVITASTINDIICITLSGIGVGLIFSTDSLTMKTLHGPISLAMGFSFGIAWGLICKYFPNIHEQYLVTLRTLLLGLGCLVATIGSDALGYRGAGPLGCIFSTFTACHGWRKQGWTTNNPVRMNFVLLWKFFEPISFGLIGMEVNLALLDTVTVGWSMIVIIFPLLFRMLVSFTSMYWTDFNVKENIFVAICWIPKATIQSALGPVALSKARELDDPVLISYANIVIVVVVLSIIVTSPIGPVLIMQLGPRCLHRTLSQTRDNI